MEEKFKKLYTLKEEPALAIFNELESLNEGVDRLIEVAGGNKVGLQEMPTIPEMPTEMTVKIAGLSTITLKGDKGDKGEKGEKGDRGADGKDGKDGETPFVDTEEIASIVQSNIEPLIPKTTDIKKELPSLGTEVKESLEKLEGDARLDKKAIAGLDDYDEVKKKALEKQPIQYIGGGSGFSSPLTSKGDLFTYNSQNARLGVGEDGQVLVADSNEATGLKWQDPSFLANITYMFSGTASGVGSYYQMPALGTWVESTEASIVTAGVSTTPTLIASFITDAGSPGVTTIPAGTYHFHIETEKSAGSNNYYVYAELYKRTAGGTETLLLTSDSSSESSGNTRIQRDVDGLLSASETLNVTDRLVVKWYAVMLSSTATITTYFDNNTDARMEMPASVVDASNFVRKSGDTMSGDLNMGGNDISNVATIEIGAGATDTTLSRVSAGVAAIEGNNIVVNTSSPTLATITTTGDIELGHASDTTLSRLSAGVLGVEGVEVPTATSTTALSNKTIGQTNTIDILDNAFTISDNADPTKKAVFQVSGVSTGTTRTYTFPNTSATIVVNSSNQSLSGQMTFTANYNSFGTGTATGTQSFATGATVNGATKTVNIGTGGVAGSTTNITIGTNAGGTSNLTIDATTALGTNSLTMTGSLAATGARVTKGWFTDIESTNMPTVGGTPILTSLTAPQFTTIELGHASDTTISRSSAGVIAVEGIVVPTISSTDTLTNKTVTDSSFYIQDESDNTKKVQFQASNITTGTTRTLTLPDANVVLAGISNVQTFTNKRITKRVGSTTSSATPTIDTDDYDCYKITALATAITSFTTNLSGTPTDFQELTIRIKDDGTARAITWGASFTNHGAILPTTTTASKTLTVKFIYDSVAAIWGCVSAVEEA